MDSPQNLLKSGHSLGRNAVAIGVLVFYVFGVVVMSLAMYTGTIRLSVFLQEQFAGHLVGTTWSNPGNATIGVLAIVVTGALGFAVVALIGLALRRAFNAFFDGPLGFPGGDLWIGAAGLLAIATLLLIWGAAGLSGILPTVSDALGGASQTEPSRNTASMALTLLPLAGISLWFINNSVSDRAGKSTTSTVDTPTSNPEPKEGVTSSKESTDTAEHGASQSRPASRNQPAKASAWEKTQANQTSGDVTQSASGAQFDPDELEYDWQLSTGVTMDDVGGMEDVKQSLNRKIIGQLKNEQIRERAEALDISLPNLLLYGPPGTGKTYLARAVANEIGLPFVKLTGGDITTKWVNESPKRVNTLFSEAKQIAAREGGAVIFLDELDAVLAKRGGSSDSQENQKVVNEFLGHLDSTDEHNILFIGATNRRDNLDEAAIRKQRISEQIEVPKPDHKSRYAIFKAQLRTRPYDLSEDEFHQLASRTDGLVAADIEAIVDEAARNLLYADDRSRTLQWQDFEVALKSETES